MRHSVGQRHLATVKMIQHLYTAGNFSDKAEIFKGLKLLTLGEGEEGSYI